MRPSAVDGTIPIIPVAGTHGYRGQLTGDWWHDRSPLLLFLGAFGFTCLQPARPFVWTTDLNGQRFWRRWFGLTDPHYDWLAAAYGLNTYIRPIFDEGDNYVPLAQRNVIVHSHGLQVVLYACAEWDLKLNSLVSVMAPVRADMQEIAGRARRNIGYWEHLYSDRTDSWQWIGGIGDGRVGIVRRHPKADRNTLVPKAGHSRLLHDSAFFMQWVDLGLLDRIRVAAGRT